MSVSVDVPPMKLACSRNYEDDGKLSISASWSLPSSSPLAVKRFLVHSSLRDPSQWGLFGIIKEFPPTIVLQQVRINYDNYCMTV